MSYPSNLQKRNDGVSNLIDVLQRNKKNGAKDICVASLAFVKAVRSPFDVNQGFGVLEVQLFPVDDGFDMSVDSYFFSDKTFDENEIVLVVFTDRDFRQIIKNKKWTKQVVKTDSLHSRMFGVTIKL